MTVEETNGSVETGTPEATNGVVPSTIGSPVETTPADPFSGLDADTRDWVGKKGIKDVASLAVSYLNAEKLIGKAVVLPGDDAKPEDWDKVWSRLGRPEKADGYELAPPESMPESLPYDQGFADWFKGAAHKANLPKTAAKALHDEFVSMSVERAKAEAQSRVDKANSDLVAAWGGKDTDTYKANLKLADRGIQTLGGDALMQSLKGAGLLGPGGEVLDASIALAFAKAGKALGSEGEFVTGGQTGGANNPFLEGKENITEIMRLIKSDPTMAASMARAAGKQLSDYGIRG